MEYFKHSPYLFLSEGNETVKLDNACVYDGVEFHLSWDKNSEYSCINVSIENKNSFAYKPHKLSVKLGIDTYMDTYPQWNNKPFPTMLRCESTHLYGYFMYPNGEVIGICTDSPAAGYSFDYNIINNGDEGYGHRIETVNIDIICAPPLPPRMSEEATMLKAGEKRNIKIYLFDGLRENNVFEKISTFMKVPIIAADKYTLNKGEKIDYTVLSDSKVTAVLTDPDGKEYIGTDKVGLYSLKVVNENGYEAQADFYVRESLEWYMLRARENFISKPPKATTHCESWYGFFSGYLAMKHYPLAELDKITDAMFDEIMPMMFDYEEIRPLVIPKRIQNISSFVSLLTDRYEAENDIRFLKLASKFGDLLMEKQREDGGYYRNDTLYTCVIYIAKSMLELYYAEKERPEEYFKQSSLRHYQSVKRAIDNLVEKLDDIQTEGEMTFEDGMLSCSALQIAYFALGLPENKREKYINAAEYMINRHRCLEQNNIPDCRMNGASIRYWEAQYDVNYVGNMLNSPHGWTAWTLYAKYYLFLLTGKAIYLKEFMNGLGACLQLMDKNGDLRWGFVCEPHLETDIFVKDEKKPVKDAYKSVQLNHQAYDGKYVRGCISEQYIPMVSDWYRAGEENPVVGGYSFCKLFLADETLRVNNQGGVCDNDVHEIFKCLEETALKKAFAAEDNGKLLLYGCSGRVDGNRIYIKPEEDTEFFYSALKDKEIVFEGANKPQMITI